MFFFFYLCRTIANYLIWRIMKNRISNLGQKFQELTTEYNKVSSKQHWTRNHKGLGGGGSYNWISLAKKILRGAVIIGFNCFWELCFDSVGYIWHLNSSGKMADVCVIRQHLLRSLSGSAVCKGSFWWGC